ncbi:MAG TPA: DUF262 domain-containing HNH endonuclease family protein [Hyphomicrobiaceae bacterium]|nr:DUF262 domain-containing HNH endonuclease family protein [Hyphomicrobiaceae bacterium]
MQGRLASEDLSVAELLSGRFAFTIPPFQRDLTWTKSEAGQLLDDIASALDDVERTGRKTPYFLGTMLFVTGEGEDGKRRTQPRLVEVVDGQQRLTTLTILFAVLRDLAPAEERVALHALIASPASNSGGYQLQLKDGDSGFFQAAIQAPGAARQRHTTPADASNVSRRNIEDIRRELVARLGREFSAEERSRFATFARRHCRVLVVTADDFDYAYQIFLTINDRGKRLTVGDIFRGEILGPLDGAQRRRFEQVIEEMDKYLDAAESTRVRGKTFFSHLAAIYGWSAKGIVQELRRAVARHGGPRAFAAEVFAPMAEAYLDVKRRGAGKAESIEQQLTALTWLEQHGDDDWVPAAMLGLVRLKHDSARLAQYLEELDRFAHGLMALGCGRPARKRHFVPALRRILASPEMPDPKTLFVIAPGDQRQILRRMATRLHLLDPPTCRLVLLRLDAAVSGRPLAAYQHWLDARLPASQRLTVEHVLPRGGIKDGEWQRLFPNWAHRQVVSECIGNLVLVTEQQNQSARQAEFKAKQEIFFTDGPHPIHLTDLLRQERTWDQAAIERRHQLMMQAAQRLWRLEGPIPACPRSSSRWKA